MKRLEICRRKHISESQSNQDFSRISERSQPDPIERLQMCFGRGEPGLQEGTVRRWLAWKSQIAEIRLKQFYKRIRHQLIYKKSASEKQLEQLPKSTPFTKYPRRRTLKSRRRRQKIPKGRDERKVQSATDFAHFRGYLDEETATKPWGLNLKCDSKIQLKKKEQLSETDSFDRDYEAHERHYNESEESKVESVLLMTSSHITQVTESKLTDSSLMSSSKDFSKEVRYFRKQIYNNPDVIQTITQRKFVVAEFSPQLPSKQRVFSPFQARNIHSSRKVQKQKLENTLMTEDRLSSAKQTLMSDKMPVGKVDQALRKFFNCRRQINDQISAANIINLASLHKQSRLRATVSPRNKYLK